MSQPIEKRGRGRPTKLDLGSLLDWECVWINLFACLRDGAPQQIVPRRSSSGVFIKASYDEEKHFVDDGEGIREEGGRVTIFTQIPGEKSEVAKQPKIIDSPETMMSWNNKAQRIEADFQKRMMGDVPETEITPAIPGEPQIWEVLKKARTTAQVRAAYNSSKIWLKHRWEFPSGGYVDQSWHPCPYGLFRWGDKFCRAKLDPRYPARDKRTSGDYQRIEFLGRAMAGFSMPRPLSASYSVTLLRKLKHLDECWCWRCRSEIAPRFPRTLVTFLRERML
jgi:hypothetical protein